MLPQYFAFQEKGCDIFVLVSLGQNFLKEFLFTFSELEYYVSQMKIFIYSFKSI